MRSEGTPRLQLLLVTPRLRAVRRMTVIAAMLLLLAAVGPRQAASAGHAHRRGLTVAFSAAAAAPRTHEVKDVAIVGGGLAGLATAWQLATAARPPASITIWDPRPPGRAEASSVAGGLLHPLSPRNKLLWAGPEGFEATTGLLAASKVRPVHPL